MATHAASYGRAVNTISDGLIGWADWFTSRAAPRLSQRHADDRIAQGLSPRVEPKDHLTLLGKHYVALAAHENTQQPRLRFHLVVLPTADNPDLTSALGSLLLQTHADWVLTVLAPEQVATVAIRRLVPERLIAAPQGPQSTRLSATIAATEADYVLLLDGHDRLLPSALSDFARRARQTSLPHVLYGDESVVDRAGRQTLTMKPRWSPLLQLQANYLGHSVAFKASALAGVTALTATPPDLAYLAIAELANRDRAPELVFQPTLHRTVAPSPVSCAAVQQASEVWRVPLQTTPMASGCQTWFIPPDPAPSVTAVIPNRDAPELLASCLESLTAAWYPGLTAVIVDNGSRDRETLALYRRLPDWITLIHDPDAFNFARLTNQGVAAATGDYILLLNNDTEAVTADWLSQMLGVACSPGVGAVGPQLRYPDGTIQHAGIVGLGAAGIGHEYVGQDPDHTDQDNAREVLAVTGACLLVGAQTLQQVGGLDETVLYNAGGDIDLCLRIRALGLSVIYQPRAVLLHHESKTRGRSFETFERVALVERWGAELASAPVRSPRSGQDTRTRESPGELVPVVPANVLERWCRAGRVD